MIPYEGARSAEAEGVMKEGVEPMIGLPMSTKSW